MEADKDIVPYILCAMCSSPGKSLTVNDIVKIVQKKLRDEGIEATHIRDEIDKALQVACEFGLISTNCNIVRLRFNPSSRSPLGFQPGNDQQESFSSDEVMDVDEATSSESNKARTSKTTAKRSSGSSLYVPSISRVKRRRKIGTRKKRRRSRTPRRRRRR